jgi:hypothetical protein
MKPSELIRAGVQDLEACEADPRYSINMVDWHSPTATRFGEVGWKSVCEVCLAGAVMAKRLRADPRVLLNLSDFPTSRSSLRALNDFRGAGWAQGLRHMGISDEKAVWSLDREIPEIVPYNYGPEAFKAQLLRAADILAQHGL